MKSNSFRRLCTALILAVSAAAVQGLWLSKPQADSVGVNDAQIRAMTWDSYQRIWVGVMIAAPTAQGPYTLRSAEGAIMELRPRQSGHAIDAASLPTGLFDVLTAADLANENIPLPADLPSDNNGLALPGLQAAGARVFVRLKTSRPATMSEPRPGDVDVWAGPLNPTFEDLQAIDIDGSVGVYATTLTTNGAVDTINFTWDIGRWAKGDIMVGLTNATYKVVDRNGEFKRFVGSADYGREANGELVNEFTAGCAANWRTGEFFITNFSFESPGVNIVARHPGANSDAGWVSPYSNFNRRISTAMYRDGDDPEDGASPIDKAPESVIFDGNLNLYVGHSFGFFGGIPTIEVDGEEVPAPGYEDFSFDFGYEWGVDGLPIAWNGGGGSSVVDETGALMFVRRLGSSEDFYEAGYGFTSQRLLHNGSALAPFIEMFGSEMAAPVQVPQAFLAHPFDSEWLEREGNPGVRIPVRWPLGKRLHRYGNVAANPAVGAPVYNEDLRQTYWTFTSQQGTDIIDLTIDNILYYTSEDSYVHRYDVINGRQLPDVGAGKLRPRGENGTRRFNGIRLLPPGDGTGGFLVVSGEGVYRFDQDGNYLQQYQIIDDPDIPDHALQQNLYGLEIDPGGRTFWTMPNFTSGWMYKFDIASGRELQRLQIIDYADFDEDPDYPMGRRLEGMCIMWEYTAAQEICGNGIDDDGDGLIDESCTPIESCSVNSPGDDDGDGLADNNDPDCGDELPPVAEDDFYTTNQGQTLTIPATAPDHVLSNDYDPDNLDTPNVIRHDVIVAWRVGTSGTPGTVAGQPVTTAQGGSATLQPDGSLVYTPLPDFHGADSFVYVVNDGVANSNIATVTIIVRPRAADDSYAMNQGTTLDVTGLSTDPPGILTNDSNQPLNIIAAGPNGVNPMGSSPSTTFTTLNGGVVTVHANGRFTYVPAVTFVGTDYFDYLAHDGVSETNVARVSITVVTANRVVAIDDGVFAIPFGQSMTLNVLANDSDPEGDAFRVTHVNGTPIAVGQTVAIANGSVRLDDATGVVTIVPAPGYSGPLSFTYSIADTPAVGIVATATATVSAIVARQPVVPVDDHYVTQFNTPLSVPSGALLGILANDTGAPPAVLSFTKQGGAVVPLNGAPATDIIEYDGTLTLRPDGSFFYEPATDFVGTTAFRYYVDDGTGNPIFATVFITVLPAAEPCVVDPTPGVALVRSYSTFDGRLEGSIQIMEAIDVTLNSTAVITGQLKLRGTPQRTINGSPTWSGPTDGPGAATPTNHRVTINHGATLGELVQRVDPIDLPTVAVPPASPGTRWVTMNNASDDPGDFATLRGLTLNSNVGPVAIPAGTYDSFTANTNTAFVLGVAGSDVPSVYHFQNLTLNSGSSLQVVGPVVITVRNSMSFNGPVGHADHPDWLTLRVSSGDVTLNAGVPMWGYVEAPSGRVTINSGARLKGGLAANTLTINSGGVLELVNSNTVVCDEEIIVAIDDKVKTYGDPDPELTYVITSGPVPPGVLTGTIARDGGEPVGLYEIGGGTLSVPPGYRLTVIPGQLTIVPRPAQVIAGGGSKLLGQIDPPLSAITTTGFLAADLPLIALSQARDAGEAIGTYGVDAEATGAVLDNYEVEYIPGVFTIGKAPSVTTVTGGTFGYDGTPKPQTCTVTGINGTVLTGGVLTYTPGPGAPVNVGTYAVTCAFPGDENHTPSNGSNTVVITPKVAKVIAGDGTKTYGTSDPALSTITTEGFAPLDLLTLTLTQARVAGETVGSYTTSAQAVGLGLLNYAVTYVPGAFTITKAPLTIKANDKTKVQGTVNPTLDGTITGLVLGDVITATYSTTAVTASPVGTYPIVPAPLDPNKRLSNYVVTIINGTLTVTPSTPPCSVSQFSFTGSSATSGTAGNIRTFTGGGVQVKVSGFSRVKGTGGAWNTAYVGVWNEGLGVTDGSEGDGGSNKHKLDNDGRLNYLLFEFSQPIVVTRAYLNSIGSDSDATVWIGTAPDPFVNHLTLSDALLAGASVTEHSMGSTTARWAAFNGNNVVGNALVIAAHVNEANDAFKVNKLDVSCPPAGGPKVATVTAGGGTKVYGTVDPALSAISTSGFLPADLSGITLAQARVAGEAVGTYAVNATATGGSVGTYTVTYVPGVFEITKATPVVTVTGGTFSYDGTTRAQTCTVKGANNVTLSGGTVSYSPGSGAPSAVGTYTATCQYPGDANHLPATGKSTIIITPKTATVTAGNGTKVYGTTDPALTAVTAAGFLAADLPGVTLGQARAAGQTVGNYTVNATATGAVTSNYAISYVPGAFTITKAPLTIKANDKTKTQGTANPVLDGTITGLVSGDVVTATYSTTAVTASPVGTYPIVPAAVDPNNRLSNYTVTLVNGKLTVTAAGTAPCSTTGYTTYSQGGWGAKPAGNNPGKFLETHFSTVYPAGWVTIGGRKSLKFTSASAIDKFLPAGGTPNVLTATATNPTSSNAGVFAGQVLALQLAVDFSAAGVTKRGLGGLLVQSGPFSGQTVDEVLALANTVLGGDTSALPETGPAPQLSLLEALLYALFGQTPPSAPAMTVSQLNDIVEALVMNFHEGTANEGLLGCGTDPGPAPCAISQFSFTGSSSSSGTAGNIRTFTAGSVQVKVSGFSRTKGTSGTWATAYVGVWSEGLGVTDGSEGDGSSNKHKVDNDGRLNYLLFEFSKPVVVTRAYLNSIGTDSDATVWIGTKTDPFNNHLTLNDALLSSLTAEHAMGGSSARWATFNDADVSGNVLIIAANVNEANDAFKVNKLDAECANAGTGSKATPVVTVTGGSFVYDGTAKTQTCSVKGANNANLTGGTITYSASPTAPINTGTYTVSCQFPGDANYKAASATSTLTITPKSATVKAGGGTKVYGTSDPSLGAITSSGFVSSDVSKITLNQSRAAGDTVGSYATTATATGAVLSNYAVSYQAGAFTITKATLTVKVNSKTKTQGENNPTLDGSISGVISGDNITVSYSTTATKSSAAGTYPITASLSDPKGRLSNYTVSTTNGTLTVSSAKPTGKPDAYSVVKNKKLTVNASSGVLANDDNISGRTAMLISAPSKGTLSLASDGSFSYQASSSEGTVTFQYVVKANGKMSDAITVTITVKKS